MSPPLWTGRIEAGFRHGGTFALLGIWADGTLRAVDGTMQLPFPLSRRRRRRPLSRRWVLLSVHLLLSGPHAAAQTPDTAVATRQLLRPGDVIRLRIWREPDMSGEFPVDERGRVVFPRLGEYSVLEDTPKTLGDRVLADYREYLKNPSIEITVLRRVRIIGAVNEPGLHLVDPTITVADALALAGGATNIGDPDRIRIIREGREIAVDIRQDTRIGDSPIRSGDQIFVPERSWVARNSRVVAATITATVSLVIALFLR
jgi:protein involved in polysaccharide export with SLBB domain